VSEPLVNVTSVVGTVRLYVAEPSPVTVNTPCDDDPEPNSVTLVAVVPPDVLTRTVPAVPVGAIVPKFIAAPAEIAIGATIVAEAVPVASAAIT